MHGYPVSVKGVVARDGRILLLHNERGEWELPGGRCLKLSYCGASRNSAWLKNRTAPDFWQPGTCGPVL